MSGYIVRIVLLLGLVILAGACVAPGDAENYKVLEQEPEPFNTEPDARLEQLHEALALGILVNERPLGAAGATGAAVGSAQNLDRTSWPQIRFAPADGTVTHYPIYFANVPVGSDKIGVLHPSEPIWRMSEALDSAKPGGYSIENLIELGLDPARFGLTLVSIPAQAMLHPPWATSTTP